MTIKHKLYLLGFTSLLSIVISLFSFSYFEGKISKLMIADHNLSQLELTLMQLRRNEKDFLLRKDDKYYDQFSQNIQKFLQDGGQLLDLLSEQGVVVNANLEQDLKLYSKSFSNLVDAYSKLGSTDSAYLKEQLNQQIGLTYKQGLQGETRTASHVVERQFDSVRRVITDSISNKTNELVKAKYTFVIIVFLLFLSMLYWTSLGINKKVNELLTLIKHIKESNDLTYRASNKGNDEFSIIGKHLNSLLAELEQYIQKSKSESDELSANAHDINQQIISVSNGFSSQSEQTNLMASSTEEISVNIKDIAHNTEDTVNEILIASEYATQGQKTLESTTRNIRELSDTLSNSQATVSTLSQNVNQIVNTMTLIQEIAEQTNLLSLNAAIEAARAGEQGRGFAVVADEVRALAKRTSHSTEEIYQIVSTIEAQMKTVVKEIADCNEQSDKTAVDALELDKSLSMIQQNMTTVKDQSQMISNSLNEQDDVLIQLNNSIAQLTEISDSNGDLLDMCSIKIADVNNQAKRMNQSVKLFKIGN
ncbi:methyl-accepting chemotaxis protein [Vibrio sp. HN007]|uniref:methyl-accepting chemotaxis protein n=1 Tax=Vibrio iocasae TaxID=3098914 RepID=UPI0035D4E08A